MSPSNEKTLFCDFCPFASKWKITLKSHNTEKHNGKSYETKTLSLTKVTTGECHKGNVPKRPKKNNKGSDRVVHYSEALPHF